MYQSIHGDMKIALWGVVVFRLLGFDGDNKLERPVGTTATNVTSRANNRTIATHIPPLSRKPKTEWKCHANWSKIHRTRSSLTGVSFFQFSAKNAPARCHNMRWLEARSVCPSSVGAY